MPGGSTVGVYLRANELIWKRLPARLRKSRAACAYGAFLHRLVRERSQRRQYTGTFFMRNRPELELMRRFATAKPHGGDLRIAVLGCSIGAETYSLSWTIRSARSDLRLRLQAVDISREVLDVAATAVYTKAASGMVQESIFERMTEAESKAMFDSHGDAAAIKPWLREGITWHLGDASDPELMRLLGPQDLVVADNFLCHMEPGSAEKCLRNLARLVDRDGSIFVAGVDLDVRAKVARELGWHPVTELIREIHEGDPSVRADWPWKWWGLEPLDDRRPDWQTRYAVAYRVPRSG